MGATVLCLGYSSILRRRVLPALQSLPEVEAVELASRGALPPEAPGVAKVARCTRGYGEALRDTRADLVYVSTVNSEHAYWVREALRSRRNVIVDKPAFLRVEEAEECVAQAASAGCTLAEATVWAEHPQVALVRRVFAEARSRIERVAATFTIPPLGSDNFRYRAALGGGAFMDLGPYAVSVGREFFGTGPDRAACYLAPRGESHEVETGFSVLAHYPGGGTLVGHFAFDTAYHNSATLLGPEVTVRFDRIFTTPPDLENAIQATSSDEATVHIAPAADTFALFLGRVLRAIRDGAGAQFCDPLLEDARAMQVLRDAGEREQGAMPCR